MRKRGPQLSGAWPLASTRQRSPCSTARRSSTASSSTPRHLSRRSSVTPSASCSLFWCLPGDTARGPPSELWVGGGAHVSGSKLTIGVSVIATVLNEEASVGVLLESLIEQTRPPDEIVVVDGGSQDETVEVIERWRRAGAPIRLVVMPGANIATGRNRAIAAASHEIIAATDAGVRPTRNWLAELVAPFERPGGEAVDVVSGFFVSAPGSVFELALGATTLPLVDEIDPARFLPSSRSVAFRKAAWARAGGYPEWLDYCEDLVFDLGLRQARARFVFAPKAVVGFRPRTSWRSFFLQYYRYARGDGKANLWLKRHAIRYASYCLFGPLALLAGIWYKSAWLALFVAVAGGVYLARPYRRLLAQTQVRRDRAFWAALALVPVTRVVGDIAKMVGYPVGVYWRLRDGRRAT
ncbi:MAG: glycosyltransferase [Chloroflexi bacterium]|nr:glycosyltransferase [Chloroflexota bacterium]